MADNEHQDATEAHRPDTSVLFEGVNEGSGGIDHLIEEPVIESVGLPEREPAKIILQQDLPYNDVDNFNMADNAQDALSSGVTVIFDQDTSSGKPSAVHFDVGHEEDGSFVLTATDQQTGGMERLTGLLVENGSYNEGYGMVGQTLTISKLDADTGNYSNFFDSSHLTVLQGDLDDNAAVLNSLEAPGNDTQLGVSGETLEATSETTVTLPVGKI